MTSDRNLSPYGDNLLIRGLGPILTRAEAIKMMAQFPPIPLDMAAVPREYRMHHLMSLRRFHVPSLEEARLHDTTALMVRHGYSDRDPMKANTWGTISGEAQRGQMPRPPSFGAAVEGISGVGKTEGILRCLNCFPSPVIEHESFPRLVGPHRQVVWLSAEVPSTGKTVDLATNLMIEWDRVTGGSRFESAIGRSRPDGMRMLNEWRQVAVGHFLGILHLDEVQNFFKLPTIRRRRSGKGSDTPELSIVEDQCIKWILTLMNTWQIPLLVSGTPDGIHAITKRLSNLQRVVTSGYHAFTHFQSASEPAYREIFLPQLGRYQYVEHKLPINDALADLIIELTAGVPRLIIALWMSAHRIAFERSSNDLRIEDFRKAANSYLALAVPAVAALRSNDPVRMARYEDLVPRQSSYWAQFWDPK